MSKKVKRIIELEKQIEEQQNLLVGAKTDNASMIHNGLLQILTDRWCELTMSLTPAEETEMAKAMGF